MRTRAINVRVVALAATLATLALVIGTVATAPVEEAHAQGAPGADYFLKIDGIEGESIDQLHPGEIEVESWSWGESNSSSAGSGGGLGTGKVSMQDFHFVMKTSKATPQLLLACAEGRHIKSATITVRKTGGETYLTYELKNVIISSFHTEDGKGDPTPTDEIAISFRKIIVSYVTSPSDGSAPETIRAGWDLGANKKI